MQTDVWLNESARVIDENNKQAAQQRQDSLTKPPGSLGILEQLAIRLAALQSQAFPTVDDVRIVVFAADHGIANENVSAFPQAVTAEMVRNFSRGGAAICVLARQIGAQLEVVNVGTVMEIEALPGVYDQRVAAGTHSFLTQPAMDSAQLNAALKAGYDAVERAALSACQVFIAGDMGIANTSSATALACSLLGCKAADIAGRGTGLDDAGLAHKVDIIQQALDFHELDAEDPQRVLQTFGGFEIAAMAGAYIRCSQKGIAVLVDGFISTAAALVAWRINPSIRPWLFFAHASAENGHRRMMEAMDARPLLDLDLRLGEASGAAVALPLMRMACAIHREMATFEQAGVSESL